MARIFISGSSDGLGLMTGELLLKQRHDVVFHARNATRAEDARKRVPSIEKIVLGDLGTLDGMKSVASQVNELGPFDTIIQNAAIGYKERRRIETADGLPHVFAINSLAPYVLTATVQRPKRYVFISSELHRSAGSDLSDALWEKRKWHGTAAYAETKLHNVWLAFAVARLWPTVNSNAIEPGWVATKMGGASARDDLAQAHLTQSWLAVSEDAKAKESGGYFYHKAPRATHALANDTQKQNEYLALCARLSGVGLKKDELRPEP